MPGEETRLKSRIRSSLRRFRIMEGIQLYLTILTSVLISKGRDELKSILSISVAIAFSSKNSTAVIVVYNP